MKSRLNTDSLASPDRWRAWLPTRGNVVFTLIIAAMCLWSVRAGASAANDASMAPDAPTASTNTIAYQGRLADAAGSPLNGTYPMTFRLYATATGGAALWTEQRTSSDSVVVSNGLFNVLLGSITSIPQNTFTANANLWLGIAVGADAEMTPRVQLGAVPFAMQAQTVPDGSIASAKIADGAVTLDKLNHDAANPSLLRSWTDDAERSFSAAGSSSTYVVDPAITVTVPNGKAYYYMVSYNGLMQYFFSDRSASYTDFFANWSADLTANAVVVGSRNRMVMTGYRYDWAVFGDNNYWQTPYNLSWLIRLEGGTHTLRVRIQGYSDGTMNNVRVRDQRIQVMQIR